MLDKLVKAIRAANLISAEVIRHPDGVLEVAIGFIPVGIYKQLIEWEKR